MDSPPDYIDDWKNYWAMRYEKRSSRELEQVANYPLSNSLMIDIREIHPETDEFDCNIEMDDLKIHPDQILTYALDGFKKFLDEFELGHAPLAYIDTIPIHLTGLSKLRTDRFNPAYQGGIRSMVDQLSSFTAFLESSSVLRNKPNTINYQCNNEHETLLIQPIYTRRLIDNCGVQDCSNSVFPISPGTTQRDILKFKLRHEDEIFEGVATGRHVDRYGRLDESEGRIRVTGIPRNVISGNSDVNLIIECLYLGGYR